MQPKTLQDAVKHFSDAQTCIDTVAKMRWPNGPECPACGHKEHYWLATQKRWKCKECYKQFTVKLGTIFEDSPLSLDKWLVALWMLVNCKNGISSYEVASTIGISQKSAWFMLHRLRLALQDGTIEKFGGNGGAVESDEAFIGGKPKNMHKSRKLRLQRIKNETMGDTRMVGKTAILGLLDREQRRVRATVIPQVNREHVIGAILKQVHHGARMYTDEATVYRSLPDSYTHEFVNHLEKYVSGQVHTNGLENFWSLLKRSLGGTYVAVEPFHLFRYVDEQAFRFNNRGTKQHKLTPCDRFNLALSQVAGKRLTFAEVTGKTGSEAF
jgi:transposase-like protein